MLWLRVLGIGLNALGAMILAWRVKGLLDEMIMAQTAHDLNIQIIAKMLNNEGQVAPISFGWSDHVIRQQERGVILLVVGFSCMAIGSLLTGASWYFDA